MLPNTSHHVHNTEFAYFEWRPRPKRFSIHYRSQTWKSTVRIAALDRFSRCRMSRTYERRVNHNSLEYISNPRDCNLLDLEAACLSLCASSNRIQSSPASHFTPGCLSSSLAWNSCTLGEITVLMHLIHPHILQLDGKGVWLHPNSLYKLLLAVESDLWKDQT